MSSRTAVTLALASLAGILAFTWPLFVDAGTLADPATAPLVLGLVLAGVLAVVLVGISDGGLDVKAVAVLGMLSALGAVLRPLSAGAAGIETVFFLLILGGRVFGPGFGFVLGATTLFASALLTGGVGPWLPFQMFGAAWVGLGAGLLPARLRGWAELAALTAYGVGVAVLYGLAMNLSFWPFQLGLGTELSFVPGAPVGENLSRFLIFSAVTSLGWEIGRAVTTAAGILVLGRPVLSTLRRAATRAAFAPVPPAARQPERLRPPSGTAAGTARG